MTLKEACEFLDLPQNALPEQLLVRYREKQTFFGMLHANAPNAIIRNLQEKNLHALEEIKKLLPAAGMAPHTSDDVKGFGQQANKSATGKDIKEPLAFLVVHTENKPTLSFPVYEGDNPVGRQAVEGKDCIVITDDIYISRYHCVIITRNNFGELSAAIADDGRYNAGKPSFNGSFYNGNANRVTTQKLNEGDTVQIGITKLVFKWNNAIKSDIEDAVALSNFIKTIVIDI